MTVADIAKKTFRTIEHNSPLILTSLAVAGVVSTAVLAVKATFDAAWLIAEENSDGISRADVMSPKEIWKEIWPMYIPAAATGIVTISCIIGAQSINSKRNAALVSGAAIVETAFREYRERIVDTLGETKEQRVRDELAQERVNANPPTGDLIVIGQAESVCYDTYSDRYFLSDMETLRRAQNDIVEQCLNDMYASVNDLYRAIGLPVTGLGEEFGWTSDPKHKLVMEFSTTLTPSGNAYIGANKPCIVINYKNLPISNFWRMGG